MDWSRRGGSARRPSSDDRVAEEQLRMIWAHSRIALLAAMAFAVSLAFALRGVAAPAAVVDAWLVAKLAISVLRAVQGWRFLQPKAGEGRSPAGATLAALVLDAAMWGAAGLYVALTAPLPLVSFVSAVLACISCVATFGLQVSARFTVAYTAPILAPTAIGLMSRGAGLEQLGGIGLLLLMGLQLSTAVRSERRLAEGIQLRWQAEALAQEKDAALKTAMRESAVKTQFLANISHELRTPLHGILGMAQLLRRRVHEPIPSQQVELIESSGQHLLGLINDLLDIARIESGQFVIRTEPFDLCGQVAQLAGIYTMRAENKSLRFELRNTLPTPCWVKGDPARFRQVLHNLLGNAVKFTERGGIVLSVSRDDARGVVCAVVRDTGIGIPSEALERIFEPFQQVDGKGLPAPGTEGAGLGLAIARDIARAMGGDIVAESGQGVGSTLTFSACLPGTAAPLTEAEIEFQPDGQAVLTTTVPAAHEPQEKPLVLLAEDNDINALVASNFLEIIGPDLERVRDGEEAVRAALRKHRRPDLVLMDCHMPRMDGYDATRAIRSQEQVLGLRRLPIVALTATASDAERQDCLDAGMDDYLSKPCTLEALSQAIDRWAVPRRTAVARTPDEPPTPPGATSAQRPDHADATATEPGALLQQAGLASAKGSGACPGAPCQA